MISVIQLSLVIRDHLYFIIMNLELFDDASLWNNSRIIIDIRHGISQQIHASVFTICYFYTAKCNGFFVSGILVSWIVGIAILVTPSGNFNVAIIAAVFCWK